MLTDREIKDLQDRYTEASLDLRTERERARLGYESAEAREQFKRLLVNAKLFSKVQTEEDKARRNFAIEILEDLGFLDEGNIESVLDFLFTLPLVGRRENKEEEFI